MVFCAAVSGIQATHARTLSCHRLTRVIHVTHQYLVSQSTRCQDKLISWLLFSSHSEWESRDDGEVRGRCAPQLGSPDDRCLIFTEKAHTPGIKRFKYQMQTSLWVSKPIENANEIWSFKLGKLEQLMAKIPVLPCRYIHMSYRLVTITKMNDMDINKPILKVVNLHNQINTAKIKCVKLYG